MQKLKWLLMFIGVVQLILGGAILFVPTLFFATMGYSVPPADLNYMFGMLAARFIAYGWGMFVIAQKPQQNLFWLNNMILIQLIDLGVGVVYTGRGAVPLAITAFPMFNATLFIGLLWLWHPQRQTPSVSSHA